MKNSTRYLIIALVTFLTGYLFLRLAYYDTGGMPFVQEIILIVLGTIVTMAITAALLNKQSEVELEKEQRVKIFDMKSDLYLNLINFIEKIILKREIGPDDLVSLEFLTHKISIIASKDVLYEYSKFLDIVKKVSRESEITPIESDELSLSLARLCSKIRYDLITGEEEARQAVEDLIEDNIEKFEA
jgi:hypothetical protein